jgi:hypothetical protein
MRTGLAKLVQSIGIAPHLRASVNAVLSELGLLRPDFGDAKLCIAVTRGGAGRCGAARERREERA